MTPQSTNIDELAEVLEFELNSKLVEITKSRGELTLVVTMTEIIDVVTFLKKSTVCLFTTLIDICAVDYPSRTKRFEVVYNFLSMQQNQRIRVKLHVREEELVPSITSIFRNAEWYEREIFDMHGVFFSGHPDLRRILTDYGFSGYPLRKDFPTTGYTEVRYDEASKRVVYEPVKLTQEYRQFDFESPWEGVQYDIPDQSNSGRE
jgi:NADH-quinone oxidoreductase subunit C